MNPALVILAAEDNDNDFVLLRCAFESAGFPHKLIGVANGVEAILPFVGLPASVKQSDFNALAP